MNKNTQLLWADFPTLQLVRTGRIVRFFGRITFIVLIVTVIAMIFVPWRQTARGIGTVMALDPQERPQAVLSPTKGVVGYTAPGIREGSYVEEGEEVLRIVPFADEGISQLESQIESIKRGLVAQKVSLSQAEAMVGMWANSGVNTNLALDSEFRAAEEKFKQAQNELDVAKAELSDFENQFRVADLVGPDSGGIVSGQEVFTKRQKVEQQRNKVDKAVNALQEARATLKAKQDMIAAKRPEIDAKNQLAEQKVQEERGKVAKIEKELVDLENKRNEFDRNTIRAPKSGYIQEWFGQSGSDTVKEGDQLFTIVPIASELCIEMKVNGNDMPLLHEGDRVRIQFEGWPAVQFVGWPSVAVGTFGGKVNRLFPTDDGKGYFRVLVTEDQHFESEADWPSDRYLRQGVRANGWVLLRRVPLGYEIWRQLNGFPPVVSDAEPTKDSGKPTKVKLPK